MIHLLSNRATFTWIGLRFLRSGGHGYTVFTSWISVIGIALGVVILTVILSIMNGFELELRNRLLGLVPHAFLPSEVYSKELATQLRDWEGIVEMERFFRGQALITTSNAGHVVELYGVDSTGGSKFIREHVISGNFADVSNGGLALGLPIANALRLNIGDTVILTFTLPSTNGISPRFEQFKLAATFSVGVVLDSALAVVDISEIERRGLWKGGSLGWRIQIDDPLSGDELAFSFPQLISWTDDYSELFRTLKLEKALIFIILSLIIALGGFNLVVGEAMLVNEKRSNIAILMTMGAKRSEIVRIFLTRGMTLSVVGVSVGLLVGVLIAFYASPIASYIESLTGQSIIEGTTYTVIPSDVRYWDLAMIVVMALGLCLLAMLRPVYHATKVDPVEVLHHKT